MKENAVKHREQRTEKETSKTKLRCRQSAKSLTGVSKDESQYDERGKKCLKICLKKTSPNIKTMSLQTKAVDYVQVTTGREVQH